MMLTKLGETVDFPDSDNISQHVTKPLGVQEVNILQVDIIIMQ